MTKEIYLRGEKITYNFQYKQVKNINLRIKPDGRINVSASPYIPQDVVEDFISSKSEWIIGVLRKYKNTRGELPVKYHTDEELVNLISDLCKRIYPYYKHRLKMYPEIKFKKMKSRWGSCNPLKEILCFNTNLVYVPYNCVEYVVYHEFTHFLQPNHSKKFYDELSKVYPEWRECRKILKNIQIE